MSLRSICKTATNVGLSSLRSVSAKLSIPALSQALRILSVGWLRSLQRAGAGLRKSCGVDALSLTMADFIPGQLISTLKDKVVLITGASSGIGWGTALVLAKHGARLALTGRKEEKLKKLQDECVSLGLGIKNVMYVVGDVSDLDFCKKLVDQVVSCYGQLDVLVNNAGQLVSNTVENMTPQQYDDIMNVNTRAVVFLTQYAVPHLEKTKGSVVNVSSVVGLRSFPGILAYCMSKAAIDHFTRCAALELAPKGIRVNAVNPGVIKTQVHLRGGMSVEQYEKFLEHGKETHALGRVGEVEEVAHTIAFLASNHASFITGATLPVDGGRHAMCPR